MKITEMQLIQNLSQKDLMYIVNKPETNPESCSVELGSLLNYKSLVIPKVDLMLDKNPFNLAPKLFASWKGNDEFLKYNPKYTIYRFSSNKYKNIAIPIVGITDYEINRNIFFDVQNQPYVKKELEWTPYSYYGKRDVEYVEPVRQLKKEDFPIPCNFSPTRNESNLFVIGSGSKKRKTRAVILFVTIRILMNGIYLDGPFTKIKIMPIINKINSTKVFNGLHAYIDM